MMKRLCLERGICRFLGGKEAAVNKTMYLACGNGLNELNSCRDRVWVPHFASIDQVFEASDNRVLGFMV